MPLTNNFDTATAAANVVAAETAAGANTASRVGNAMLSIIGDADAMIQETYTTGGSGGVAPFADPDLPDQSKVQFFSAIVEPYDDGGGNTAWRYIVDSAHQQPVYLQDPVISANGLSIELNYDSQIDKILAGWVVCDGQINQFEPGLSMNTSKLLISPKEKRRARASFRLVRSGGSWNRSFIETPTDGLDTSWDTYTVTETTAETIEIVSNSRSYIGYPHVQVDDREMLIRQDYTGAANYNTTIRVRKMDFNGNLDAWVNGDALLVNWDVDQPDTLIQMQANDPRFHQLTGANYWVGGFLLLN